MAIRHRPLELSGKSRLFHILNRPVVYAAVFACLIAPAIFIGLYSYYESKHAMEEAALGRRQAVAETAAIVIETRLDGLVGLASSWVERPAFRQLVAEGKWREAIDRLDEDLSSSPDVERIALTDVDGIITADLPAVTPSVIGQSRTDRDWYKGVTLAWEPYVSEIIQRMAEPKYNVITVAAPIKDTAGKPIGILGMQVKLESIIGWLDTVQPEPPALIYGVDQHGNIVGHPWYPPQGDITNFSSVPVVQEVLAGRRGIERFQDTAAKEDIIAAFAPVEGHGWGVIYQEPVRSVFAAVDRQLRLQAVIYTLIVVTIGLLSLVILYVLARVNRYRQQQWVIMNSIGDGVFAIDRDWNIVLWNKMAEKLSGWSAAEVLGKPFRDMVKFIRAKDGAENILFIEEAMLHGENRSMEGDTLLVTKDGRKLPVGDSVAPIFDQMGRVKGAIVVFRDVSAEFELEESRKKMVKLKDDFLFKTVHDLRAPSTIIKLVIESYEGSEMMKDPQVAKNFDFMRTANGRILKLIEELLKIGRDANPQFLLECKPLALKSAMDALIAEMSPKSAARKISFEHAATSESLTVMVNQDAFKEVMVNLIDNAIKYNKDGGKVTVGYTVVGRMVEVRIQDTGPGIPEEHKAKLFQPYYRAGAGHEVEGSGLGLYIVKNLVEKMGGSIRMESTVGQGTCFTISLPLA